MKEMSYKILHAEENILINILKERNNLFTVIKQVHHKI